MIRPRPALTRTLALLGILATCIALATTLRGGGS